MPIYEYECECGTGSSEFFATMKLAEPCVDSITCKGCGKKAKRSVSQIGGFFMNFGDAPKYSSNSNPEKV